MSNYQSKTNLYLLLIIEILVLLIGLSVMLGTPPLNNSRDGGIVVYSMVIVDGEGVHMCKGQLNRYTGIYYQNPFAPLFPELIVDC